MSKTRTLLLAGTALSVLATAPGFADEATDDLQKASQVDETFTFTANIDNIRGAMRPQIIVRDDLSPTNDPFEALANSVDEDDTWSPVVQLFLRNNGSGGVFLNCTGTLINPRTVLTAAHCVNSSSSEAYGLAGAAPLSILVGFGPDTQSAIFNTINTGATYSEGGVATSTDVIIHPSSELSLGGLPFPWADVAMIALDEPITDVPTMAMLFSPLEELTRVVLTGYGTQGTGELGAGPSLSPFLRLEGENMLGMIGSPADLIDGVFPDAAPSAVNFGVETQTMYWVDFDRPDRDPSDCVFTGFNISCSTLEDVTSIDWFDGDALPNEVATAPGDSGSPMIATELTDFPIILGVLSGGFDFFGINNRYSDISFYNPLFPFFEFISANSPYKYVSAVEGDGRWLDASHWTQDLDPNFYVIDAEGNLVNGLPDGSEEGVYASDDKVGFLLGNDISGNSTDDSPFLPPQDSGAAPTGGATNAVVGVAVAEPGFGQITAGSAEPASSGNQGSADTVLSIDAVDVVNPTPELDAPNFGDNLPQSSVLQGPGSTGFVPDNTDGTPGVAFSNPAQYFDVSFTQAGTTTLDDAAFITVDQVTLMNGGATLRIDDGAALETLIGTNVLLGTLYVEETAALFTPVLVNDFGIVQGSGVIFADDFINRGGIVDPDFVDPETTFGELTIVGDYTQQAQGVLKIDILGAPGAANSVENLGVLGAANLDGTIWITADASQQARGTTYSILNATTINGTFANEMTQISAVLSFDLTYNANDVTATVVAADYADVLANGDPNARALGASIDAGTSNGAAPSGDLGSVVRSLDALPTVEALNMALGTMAPTETFVFDQMGLNSSRGMQTMLLNRPNRTRQAAGGLDMAGLNIRGDNTPTLLASSAQDTPMGMSQQRILPDNMTAFIAGDIVFSEDRAAAVSGEVDTALVTAGIETRINPNVVGGLAVTGSWVEAGDEMRTYDGDGYGIAAYVGAANDLFYANAVVGYLGHSYNSERPVFNGTTIVDATGSTDATQVYAAVEGGLTASLASGGQFGPLARIRTSSTEIDGYTEEGAGAFGVRVNERDVEQTTATVAVSGWTPVTDNLILSGEIGVERIIDGDEAPTGTAVLVSNPGNSFTLTGLAPDASYLTTRFGAGYQLTEGAIIEAQYERDFNRDEYNYQRFMVALRFGF